MAIQGIETWATTWAAALVLLLVGVALKCETRSLLLGLVLYSAAPSYSSLLVAAVFSLIAKAVSMIHIGRG